MYCSSWPSLNELNTRFADFLFISFFFVGHFLSYCICLLVYFDVQICTFVKSSFCEEFVLCVFFVLLREREVSMNIVFVRKRRTGKGENIIKIHYCINLFSIKKKMALKLIINLITHSYKNLKSFVR